MVSLPFGWWGNWGKSEPNEILGLIVSFLGLLKRIEKNKNKKQKNKSMNHSLKLVLVGFFTWVSKNGGSHITDSGSLFSSAFSQNPLGPHLGYIEFWEFSSVKLFYE
jgi:hypothetical protein